MDHIPVVRVVVRVQRVVGPAPGVSEGQFRMFEFLARHGSSPGVCFQKSQNSRVLIIMSRGAFCDAAAIDTPVVVAV